MEKVKNRQMWDAIDPSSKRGQMKDLILSLSRGRPPTNLAQDSIPWSTDKLEGFPEANDQAQPEQDAIMVDPMEPTEDAFAKSEGKCSYTQDVEPTSQLEPSEPGVPVKRNGKTDANRAAKLRKKKRKLYHREPTRVDTSTHPQTRSDVFMNAEAAMNTSMAPQFAEMAYAGMAHDMHAMRGIEPAQPSSASSYGHHGPLPSHRFDQHVQQQQRPQTMPFRPQAPFPCHRLDQPMRPPVAGSRMHGRTVGAQGQRPYEGPLRPQAQQSYRGRGRRGARSG